MMGVRVHTIGHCEHRGTEVGIRDADIVIVAESDPFWCGVAAALGKRMYALVDVDLPVEVYSVSCVEDIEDHLKECPAFHENYFL